MHANWDWKVGYSNSMYWLYWRGFVLYIYLQVSFGNASFLYTELKVLHLPIQQKNKHYLRFLFQQIKERMTFNYNDQQLATLDERNGTAAL